MRVLSINDYSDPSGGAERIWRQTSKLLRDRGVETRDFAADMVLGRRTAASYLHSARFSRAVARVVADWRPDVVHLHNYYHHASPSVLAALGSAKAAGQTKAVVLTAHDFHLLCPNPGLVRWRGEVLSTVDPSVRLSPADKLTSRWDEWGWARSELRALQHIAAYDVRRLQRVLDRIYSPSRFLADALDDIAPTVLLPNPAPAPVPVTKPDGPLRSVFIGRLVPEKGLVPFLERAPASLLDHLIVAGTGREEVAARAVVARRGVGTTFVGRVSRQRVLELAAEAHLVVLPSRSAENAPNALFEGLARGASILGTDVPGVREIVRETGVGHLYEPGSIESLAHAVAEAEKAHQVGELNDLDVDDYLLDRSEEHYVDRLVASYTDLVAPTAAPSTAAPATAPTGGGATDATASSQRPGEREAVQYSGGPVVPQSSLPNALYIGLARAGSTWLSEVLRHHPDVYVPPIKDLYFFDREYGRGLDWYAGYFAGGADHAVRMEFSHDYLQVPYVPGRVAQDLDDPALLMTLREPVSWVVSTYRNMVRNGNGGESFGWAVAEHLGLVAGGLYSSYVQLWLETFGPERVKVLLFDDLRSDPQGYLDDVLTALDLAPMAIPALDDQAVNAAAEPRWPTAARAVRASAQVARRMGQPETVGRLKRSKLVRSTLYREPQSSEPISDEVTHALHRLFREDVHRLAELTGIDVVDRWGY